MASYNKFFSIVLILVTLCVISCSGGKILFLLPLATRSHVHVYEPLMRALGERGHEVVAVSPLKSSNMPATVRQIPLVAVEDITGKMPNPFEQRKMSTLQQMMNSSTWEQLHKACDKIYENPATYDLLKNEQFDLIIVNIYLSYCVLGFMPHFKAPYIYVTTTAAPSSITSLVGNRFPPSFVPTMMLPYSDRMSFKERLINTIFDGITSLVWVNFVMKPSEVKYRKNMPGGDKLPTIDEINSNVSMIFMNGHFTLTYPRPLLPDVIEVGGMHTRPAKKLPKDLDDFLTGSGKDGFIFFSLGSIVKAREMPESTRKVFLNVFSRLKQRVIWKWETETMPDLPKNVKLSKWLPQQDVLGHPNIKLFISHGGLLSTQESVYHGVPVLGLPIFGDQDLNVKQAVKGGYAKFVEIVDITEEKLETALLELLNNPEYTQKVKQLSKVVKDLPQTPLEKAVYWSEYVLRYQGATHLKSAARDLNFFQYYVLDVAAVLIAIVLILVYLLLKCCKTISRKICGGGGGRSHIKRD